MFRKLLLLEYMTIRTKKLSKYVPVFPMESFFVIPVTALHRKLPFGIGNRAFPAIQGT